MKKYGKYEKRPEGVPVKQPKVKSALLQTYLTSLLCMVLCVTMFFGTSFAWFTSEVTNTGNEIYIGKLDVGLFAGSEDLSDNGSKLFDSTNIRWEPGYTALETIKVVDEGDLAFKYVLTFTDGSPVSSTLSIGDIAKWFDIWVYDHQQNNDAPTAGSYADIKAENGWKPIGTLAEVLGGKAVLEGKMEEADVVGKDTVHTYTIALHMNGEQVAADQENALNALMGQKVSLTVKLVAHQMASETDGFGNADYDEQETNTQVTPENINSIDFSREEDATYYLSGNFAGTYTINLPADANITIDGSQAQFSDEAVLFVNAPGDADNYGNAQNKELQGSYTIKNLNGQGALNFIGYNTTVNITDNELGFLGLSLANATVNVIGNKINAAGKVHNIWNEQTNGYGVYLYAVDYDLTFTENTVINTSSNAVGINGRKANPGWPGSETNQNAVADNSIIFTDNTISGYGAEKAALKIWDDTYYAKDPMTSEDELNEKAKNLITHILATESKNSITVPADTAGVFDFYDLKLNALSSE